MVSRGRLAQLGERLVYTQEVGGSIPSPPIFTRFARPAFRSLGKRAGSAGLAVDLTAHGRKRRSPDGVRTYTSHA